MSILIKGMDKPKTCWDCVKHFDIECNGNIQDCPIVEVDDRKTEPNNSKVSEIPTGSTSSKMEQVETEPQTERHLPDYSVEAQIGRELMDCAWK